MATPPTHTHAPRITAQLTDSDVDLIRRGVAYGNNQVLNIIRTECVAVDEGDGLRWFDVRPMLDMREHSPETVDEHAEALQYALDVGLVFEHAFKPGLAVLAPGLVL